MAEYMKFRLYHNDQVIFEHTDENQCWFKLQRSQSQSADWATRYEGWRVMGVTKEGVEVKMH